MKKILAILTLTLSTSICMAKDNLKSGYFYLTNKTNKTVSVGVGNFFPTKYTIKPHSSKFVYVSTNNQNIEIKSIK